MIAAVMGSLAAGVLGSAGVSAASSVRPVPGTNCPVFPGNNYWHARIDRLPVSSSSAQWMSNMHASKNLHPDFGPSFGEQEVPYGIPITVIRGAARVPVSFEYADESDKVRYPLSKETLIEGGSNAGGDRHAIVIDADTCTLFETWNTRQTASGWTAGSGAVWSLRSNALRPRTWTSADAAGLPILPGLLRWDEVKAGRVDHAIRFTTDVTQRAFVWPARHQAGSTTDRAFPPMGARFRLKSGFSTAGYSTQAMVVLNAMKQYGLVLADNGSPWFFQGDADPAWPADLIAELKGIPASAFEAVDTARLQVSPNSAAAKQLS
ncbi:MAG: hypothetical protein Q7K25_07615 [Actinomycetota bacterium]|nr:hypothetical protein [Actinomycetota bacterium]